MMSNKTIIKIAVCSVAGYVLYRKKKDIAIRAIGLLARAEKAFEDWARYTVLKEPKLGGLPETINL